MLFARRQLGMEWENDEAGGAEQLVHAQAGGNHGDQLPAGQEDEHCAGDACTVDVHQQALEEFFFILNFNIFLEFFSLLFLFFFLEIVKFL